MFLPAGAAGGDAHGWRHQELDAGDAEHAVAREGERDTVVRWSEANIRTGARDHEVDARDERGDDEARHHRGDDGGERDR